MLTEYTTAKGMKMNMKIMTASFMALVVGVAQAVQMTYSDDAAGTVTQTYDSGAFQPGVPSTIPITFRQFDNYGGAATLTRVTVTVTQYAWGGYYAVDNDGDTIANVSVQHGAVGSITMTAGYEYFLPAGALSSLSTVTSSARELGINDGDANNVYNADAGADHFRLDGPAENEALSAGASGSRTSNNGAYVGNGNLSLDYTVSQSSFHSGEGAVYYSGGPAWVSTSIIVTYEYVPEPTSCALLAFGCAALGLRRRSVKRA